MSGYLPEDFHEIMGESLNKMAKNRHYGRVLNELCIQKFAGGGTAIVRIVGLSTMDCNWCRIRFLETDHPVNPALPRESDHVCEWLKPVTDPATLAKYADPAKDPKDNPKKGKR